ncbi:MAG: preprotein translocase subunit SecE [Armatimonadota bacterium]
MGMVKTKTKETERAKPATSGAGRPPIRRTPSFERIRRFLNDVWIELKRCEWPTREQVVRSTMIVLGFIAVMSVYIGALDVLLSWVTRALRLF